MKEIPEKGELVQLTQLRIDKNIGKVCKCRKSKKVLNTDNRQVYCESCGALLDPFDALLDVTRMFEKRNHGLRMMQEQTMELANYKPWLKVIKSLEKSYRGKKMLPSCPRCAEPFYLEEVAASHWMGKKYADARIAKYKREHEVE